MFCECTSPIIVKEQLFIFLDIFDSSENEEWLFTEFDLLDTQILVFEGVVDESGFVAKITRV